MGRTAKLTSVDAVRTVAVALAAFRDAVVAALTDLDIEARRACDYVRVDRRNYWKEEVRRGWDRLAQAKARLQERETLGKVAGHEPSCIEEKRAVQTAARRLDIAQEKVDRVRHWTQTVDRAVAEYQGSLGQLTRWIEAELPQALALLDRIEDRLAQYLAVASPLPDAGLADAAARFGGGDRAAAGVEGTSTGGDAPSEPDSREEARGDQAAAEDESESSEEQDRS